MFDDAARGLPVLRPAQDAALAAGLVYVLDDAYNFPSRSIIEPLRMRPIFC